MGVISNQLTDLHSGAAFCLYHRQNGKKCILFSADDACVRPSCTKSSLTQYPTNQIYDFGAVGDKHKLIRF